MWRKPLKVRKLLAFQLFENYFVPLNAPTCEDGFEFSYSNLELFPLCQG